MVTEEHWAEHVPAREDDYYTSYDDRYHEAVVEPDHYETVTYHQSEPVVQYHEHEDYYEHGPV